MISIVLQSFAGMTSFFCYLLNTVFWFIPIILLSLLKILIPLHKFQKALGAILDGCASKWISVNSITQKLIGDPKIEVKGLTDLSLDKWYLVISNHQSWVDILILQRVFNKKIPFLKFFLKSELIWVPILGIVWWALGFPFMKRYSKKFISKNPHMKGKDVETTKKACAKFRHTPVSVMNFVEGTRFTKIKHGMQESSFNNLLNPKAGGIALALDSMSGQLETLVNVTIYYPQGIPSFWQFLCGQVRNIQVKVETQKISSNYVGSYSTDKNFQKEFQQWVNQIWQDKDQELDRLKKRKDKFSLTC